MTDTNSPGSERKTRRRPLSPAEYSAKYTKIENEEKWAEREAHKPATLADLLKKSDSGLLEDSAFNADPWNKVARSVELRVLRKAVSLGDVEAIKVEMMTCLQKLGVHFTLELYEALFTPWPKLGKRGRRPKVYPSGRTTPSQILKSLGLPRRSAEICDHIASITCPDEFRRCKDRPSALKALRDKVWKQATKTTTHGPSASSSARQFSS